MAKKTVPKRVIEEIKEYVSSLKADKLPVRKVILFGSFAKGKQHKWSDIDICVISPKFKDAGRATHYLWSKRRINDIRYTIEPVGFSPKDFEDKYDSFIEEIRTTGIEIPV